MRGAIFASYDCSGGKSPVPFLGLATTTGIMNLPSSGNKAKDGRIFWLAAGVVMLAGALKFAVLCRGGRDC